MILFDFFATCAKGLEPLVAGELKTLGADHIAETRAGVAFQGAMAVGLRTCLWSRLASRVLLPVARFDAFDQESLYQGVRAVAWDRHLPATATLAVSAHCSGSRINHSHFAALKVKDAIVDQFRDQVRQRPSVATVRPDLQINLHLHNDQAIISIDLSGESLHRRGYRLDGMAAPLKENLASAILIRAGWPDTFRSNGPLIDPMCGSGTLPIEAALMAGDVAPGLFRSYFGFQSWLQHQPDIWEDLIREALQRKEQGLEKIPPIVGYDANKKSIQAALENSHRAGLSHKIHFERRELDQAGSFPGKPRNSGLVIINPPYGERLGEVEELRPLYNRIGTWLKEEYQGWRVAVITANPELGRETGLKAHRMHTLYNGALKCKLLHFVLDQETYQRPRDRKPVLSAGAEMLANRLSKNIRAINRWAGRQDISCFRIYDCDLPEYRVTIDLFENQVLVAEPRLSGRSYGSTAHIRRQEIIAAIRSALDTPREHIFTGQVPVYTAADRGKQTTRHGVKEDGARFFIDLTAYPDCGLVLHHRGIRRMIRSLSPDRKFLNLFAGPATATVAAGLGGARATCSVEISREQCALARRNLAANSLAGPEHQVIQAAPAEWLELCGDTFDIILLTTPVTGQGREDEKASRPDPEELIRKTARLLSPGGCILLVINDPQSTAIPVRLSGLSVKDISARTVPRDFSRTPGIHSCYEITVNHQN